MVLEMRGPSYWILTALTERPRHGYAILKEVESLSRGQTRLRVTTLYAALDRLETHGLIAINGEETVDGRLRRYFRLTAGGASALAMEAGRLAENAQRAAARLQDAGWLARPRETEVG